MDLTILGSSVSSVATDRQIEAPGLRRRRPGEPAAAARLLGPTAEWRQLRHRPASRLERLGVDRAERRARAPLGGADLNGVAARR